MNKVSIDTLAMIVTNKCNLDCAHCLRGCKNNNDMTTSVVDFTLNQVCSITNLSICGGEPTLALPIIEYIIKYVVDNKINVYEFTTTINGTIYSEEFLRLLDYINEYIIHHLKEDKAYANFAISLDNYHLAEIERLGMLDEFTDNINKYSESKYFIGFQGLNKKLKLFREGNATKLPDSLTVPIRPLPMLVTYAGKKHKLDMENGLCNIGPIITIDTDGIITDCDASLESQKNIYNYGNVLKDNIEEVAVSKGKILKPNRWLRQCNKEVKIHNTYNK